MRASWSRAARSRPPSDVGVANPPLALYVHIPWCVRKCPYCDFNSHQRPADATLPEDQYVEALLSDLDLDLRRIRERPLTSVFIGGGTPSLFDPRALQTLLEGVRSRIACAPDLEVTLEANPGTIEHGQFAAYREAGINRVSLGVQSFSATHLKALGRIHSPDDVVRAVDELRAAGIGNFNLDLMYGLPAQTPAEAVADVQTALAQSPAHLSLYQLTLEPGTVFHHRPPAKLPDEEGSWEMQTACQSVLGAKGFEQYEVSAYALPGFRCRHNLNYWKFGDYIGIGAGAHGKLTDLESATVRRTVRLKQPATYLKSNATDRLQESHTASPTDLPFEFMLNALRLREGFTLREFEAHTGLEANRLAAKLTEASERQLLETDGAGAWRPSPLGWRFLNDLQGLFLP